MAEPGPRIGFELSSAESKLVQSDLPLACPLINEIRINADVSGGTVRIKLTRLGGTSWTVGASCSDLQPHR